MISALLEKIRREQRYISYDRKELVYIILYNFQFATHVMKTCHLSYIIAQDTPNKTDMSNEIDMATTSSPNSMICI